MKKNENIKPAQKPPKLPFIQRCGIFFRYVALILFCATTLFPLVWTFMSAFKNNAQIYGHPFALPNPIIVKNFSEAWKGMDVFTTAGNSLIYAGCTVLLVMVIALPAAFYCTKIARTNRMHNYIILGIMIPVHAILIPLFVSVSDMGLYNTKLGIIIAYVACNLSFSVFVLSGFMRKAIPNELIEASVIDGCNIFGAFMNIIPLCKSGIATATTFIFLGVWNEMMFAMCLLPGTKNRTLNIACLNLQGQFASDQGLLSAGIVIMVIPALLIFALFQEQVVKGLTAGAVKG